MNNYNNIFKRSGGLIEKTNETINNNDSTLYLGNYSISGNITQELDIQKQIEKDISNQINDLFIPEDAKKLKNKLNFVNPNILYTSICDMARTIPKINLLMVELNQVFEKNILINVYNLLQYSPKFYTENILNKQRFITYQAFIYLITMIIYISKRHNDESFLEKSPLMPNVVSWCIARNLPDLEYLIIGPVINTNYNINYVALYKSLISNSNSSFENSDDLSAYLQLMSIKKIENYMYEKLEFDKNYPNSYNKIQNRAESYTIYYDTNYGCIPEEDHNGNLVINCQYVEIGDTSKSNINLKYRDMTVSEKMIEIDPKTSANKLTALMTKYGSFKIQKFLINSNVYQTSLDAFEQLYVVFPNIYSITRNNYYYNNGTLQISGKFKLNENNWYEFIPDQDNGVNFKSSTTTVKKVDFILTDQPNGINTLIHYKHILMYDIDDIYNIPLLIHYENNQKKKDTIFFSFYEYDVTVKKVKYSVFVYNAVHHIIQHLEYIQLSDEIMKDLHNFTFDINYIYSDQDMSMPYNLNKYKAYKSKYDLLRTEWTLNDYINSLKKITTPADPIRTQYFDLCLEVIDFDIGEQDICYYSKRIINTPYFLIINSELNEINNDVVFVNEERKKYIIENLTNDLIILPYNDYYDDKILSLRPNIEIKMIIELC